MNAPSSSFLLVVEDSQEDFETLLEAARRAGLTQEIRQATSGEECLHLIGEWESQPLSDLRLVLLDLNTPRGDGRAALRGLRQSERFHAVPVVVLSTSANPRDVDYCYRAGANAYHTKPLGYPEHLQILQQIFAYWLGAVVPPSLPPHSP